MNLLNGGLGMTRKLIRQKSVCRNFKWYVFSSLDFHFYLKLDCKKDSASIFVLLWLVVLFSLHLSLFNFS